MFKKTLMILNPDIENCIQILMENQNDISLACLVKRLLKSFNLSQEFVRISLKELMAKHKDYEILEVLKTNHGFTIRSIATLLDLTYKETTDQSNILPIFAHIFESCTKSEMIYLSKHINRLSGSAFQSPYFINNAFRFFSIIKNYEIDFYFKPFFNTLCSHLESLDDSALSDPHTLLLCRHLACCNSITQDLATRILNIHINFFIRDHISFLHIFPFHKEKEQFYERIHERVLPEVFFK